MQDVMNMLDLKIVSQELFARGDTFDNRDILRHLGFRWDSQNKVWHRPVSEQRTLSYILGMFNLNDRHFSADATVACDHIMPLSELIEYRKELVELTKIIQRL